MGLLEDMTSYHILDPKEVLQTVNKRQFGALGRFAIYAIMTWGEGSFSISGPAQLTKNQRGKLK